jgi:hypothetical protein
MNRWALAALAPLVLSLGCTDYAFYTQKHTDVFQQNARNRVDVLLVVDNSCSMVEEQNKLANNFDAFIEIFETEAVDVQWQMAVITTDTVQEQFRGKFVGGDDEIILSGPTGALVDRVTYDRDWVMPVGASMALDPAFEQSTYNDVADNWCPGLDDYGSGDLGSPGVQNGSCGAKGPEDSGDTGTDTGEEPVDTSVPVSSPQAGDVILTEFLATPAGVDQALGEWVELKNVSEGPVSLDDCSLSDSGKNSWTFPEGLVLQPGEFLVVARSADSADNGGIEGAVAAGEDLTLNDTVTVLTPDTDNSGEIFSEMVAQGTSGSGIEMGLEAARMAFTDELLASTNDGFLREEANLSFIFVSDEDDDSPYKVDDYLRYFTDLKGEGAFRDHQRFNISAVVGPTEPEFDGQPSCSSPDGTADYGSRYIDLADRTEGLVESICDEDFSGLARDLGLHLSGLAVEFELSELPDVTTLEGAEYETADDATFLRDLVLEEDFDYIRERNSVRFRDGKAPAPEHYITISYEVLATGASQDESGDTGGAE